MSVATLSLNQNSPPQYAQVPGTPPGSVPTPTAGLRTTLEAMLKEINEDLTSMSALLLEVSYIGMHSMVSRDLFSQTKWMDFYIGEKTVCWKGLQDERGRLLQRQQDLKVELAKLTAQEQQQELEIQTWLGLDRARERRLEFVNACIVGIESILVHMATPKLIQSAGSYYAPFEKVVISPEGYKLKPFLRLKTVDSAACLQELARLGQEKILLDPVTLCLSNVPAGAWAHKAATLRPHP